MLAELGVADLDCDGETVCVGVVLGVPEELAVPVGDVEGVPEGLDELVGLGVVLGVGVTEPDEERLCDGLPVRLGVPVLVVVSVAEGVRVCERDEICVNVCVCVPETT